MTPALRSLAKRPVFTSTVILTLALGTGLAATILSLLHEVFLKPLPYADGDRLAVVYSTYPERGWERSSASIPEVQDLRERATLLDSVTVFAAWRSPNLTGDGPAERIETNFSEAGYLEAQGATPFLGRLFTAAESRRDSGAQVAVITHRFWQQHLGGRADVLGATIQFNGRPFSVIGVLPATYRDIGERWQRTEVFLPLAAGPMAYNSGMFDTRGGREYYGLVRLKPGVTPAQAQQEADRIALELARLHPADHTGRGLRLMPLREFFYGDLVKFAAALAAGAAFVLLIAAVNLAHLFLVQGEARRGELAVRAALGADRGTLLRLCLVDALVPGALGGTLGLGLSHLLVGIFNREGVLQMPTFTVFTVNAWAVGGALLLLGLCAGAVALLPALRASRVDLREALQAGGRAPGSRAASRRRHLLISAEIALAVMLLVGAGLTVRTLLNIERTPTGYEASRLLTATVDFDRARYSGPVLRDTVRRLQTEIAAVPGVESVVHWGPRVLGRASYNIVTTPGSLDSADLKNQFMTRRLHLTPDGFQALGIPLVAGTTFASAPAEDAPWEVVVGENYARRFFPRGDAVGQTVRIHFGQTRPARIVGVAANVRHSGRTYDETPLIGDIYFSMWQLPSASQSVLIRHHGAPGPVLAAVKDIFARADPLLALADVATMDELLHRETGLQELTASLFGFYAVLATFLAALGVYGVLAFAISQRTREFGVRLAIGARPAQVLGLVLREGLLWIGLGVAAGLFGAFHLAEFIRSLLFGIAPDDPGVLALTGAGVLLVGLIACLGPALRAARTDPLVALRAE
jgi:predicted permease